MKYDKFFELAKAAGIEEAELFVTTSYALSFSLFHGEVDKYSLENGSSYVARGIINGKFGMATSDVFNKEKAEYLVNQIVENAKVIETEDPAILFKGSPKYKKVNTFNKELGTISIDTKMAKLFELEKKIKELDSRIVEVESVEFAEDSSSFTLMNSHGLKLTQKVNDFFYVGAAVAKQGEQVKTGYEVYIGNNYEDFDVDTLAKKVVDNAVSQLGAEPCNSMKCKAVFAPGVVGSLLRAYIGNANAEDIQKNSSLFINKLGTKIASNKLTVEDAPLKRNIFTRWFDDEGVATYNKPIIKNGVLTNILYNLTTAKLDGVETTGNGYNAGGKMGIYSTFLDVKPGKKTQEQLFEEVGNGIYITDVTGLHAGLNPKSGNFSLQANGFLVEDGKKTTPVELITISGNLMEVFKDILAVGNDVKLLTSGLSTPSILIKKIVVSGK